MVKIYLFGCYSCCAQSIASDARRWGRRHRKPFSSTFVAMRVERNWDFNSGTEINDTWQYQWWQFMAVSVPWRLFQMHRTDYKARIKYISRRCPTSIQHRLYWCIFRQKIQINRNQRSNWFRISKGNAFTSWKKVNFLGSLHVLTEIKSDTLTKDLHLAVFWSLG